MSALSRKDLGITQPEAGKDKGLAHPNFQKEIYAQALNIFSRHLLYSTETSSDLTMASVAARGHAQTCRCRGQRPSVTRRKVQEPRERLGNFFFRYKPIVPKF